MIPETANASAFLKSKTFLHVLSMALLFFVECEYLLRIPAHEEVRKALRALVGLPAPDMLFAALTFALFIKLLSPSRIPDLDLDPFSPGLLLAHLVCTALFDSLMLPLYAITQRHPSLAFFWILVLAGYFVSWLVCLLRPRKWVSAIKLHAPWFGLSLIAGTISLYLPKGLGEVWNLLPRPTLWVTEQWLKLFFDDVVLGPGRFDIGLPNFTVSVKAGCSGYEGMGLIICYSAWYLWLRRKVLRFPAALSLLPLGIALSWVANTIRITVLVMLGSLISPKLALEGFHSRAGWLVLTLLGLAMVFVVERFGWFREDRLTPLRFPALPFLVPILVLFFLQILTGAFTDQFDFWYPLRTVIVLACLFHFREIYRPLLKRPTFASLLCGLAVYLVWMLLASPGESVSPSQYLSGGLLTFWLLMRVVGAVVAIPLVEELAFRAYLLRRLQSKTFEEVPIGHLTFLSVVLSSIAFGLLHSDWLAGTLAGLAYALVLRGKRSLSDAVLAHGFTNLCLAIHVLWARQWGYW